MNAIQPSLTLGFAGTPRFAVAALEAVCRSRHRVAAVFTKPDRPVGRGQAVQFSPVKQRAGELGVAVHQPLSFKAPEAVDLLRELRLDALVVVAYGLILPPAALAAPRLGCFNIHASLLPRWRGAAPVQRALLAGDSVTGITIMKMEAGLDTGPMLAIRSLEITATDTSGTLHERLSALGGDAIVDTLDALADGASHADPQPAAGVTYAHKIDKAEAVIDWNDDAAMIQRRVRAFNPWPVAETTLDGSQLRIWEAVPGTDPRPEPAAMRRLPGCVLAASGDGIDVACGRGTLRILRLQLAGRKPLAAGEFLKARPLAGACFASP